MTKPFMFFLALFVALGLSIGGSFAGGVAFGRSQDNEAGAGTPTLAIPGNFARSSGSNFGGNFGQTSAGRSPQSSTADSPGDGGLPENLAELRQRIQSGDVSPEDLARLREQFQSGNFKPESLVQLREQFLSGDATAGDTSAGDASAEDLTQLRQSFGGRPGGGITGTVDAVDGNQLMVDTASGPRTVTIGPDTVIQKSSTGTLDDLQQGVRIAAFGATEGEEASFVVLIPEGAAGLFGDGIFFGNRPRQGEGGFEGTEGSGERRFRRGGGPTP